MTGGSGRPGDRNIGCDMRMLLAGTGDTDRPMGGIMVSRGEAGLVPRPARPGTAREPITGDTECAPGETGLLPTPADRERLSPALLSRSDMSRVGSLKWLCW